MGMATAIHIELNLICLIILGTIAHLSHLNVNQQMKRVLFRDVVYGLLITLTLDTVWMLIDGHVFPGGIILNKIVNALFLGAGVMMGCIWYLYVLETLKYNITKRLTFLVLFPGFVFLLLNIASIWTGWIFTVNEQNVYIRGNLFWLQTIGSLGILFISLIHIVVCLIIGRKGVSKKTLEKLGSFYIIPVLGTLAALPFSGMPGTWTCASLSVVLMYMEEQDRAILTDGLTGLNNRKNLEQIFDEYVRQHSDEKRLYLYMIDLDDFKQINDTYGHSVGDKALVEAAGLIRKAAAGLQAVVMRYGGDEFLIMGFFPNDEAAMNFKNKIRNAFVQWNEDSNEEYVLAASVGYSPYIPPQTLEAFVSSADENLYRDKNKHKEKKRKTHSYAV